MDSQTRSGRRRRLAPLLILSAAACLCSGCFITNCPPGGKRAGYAALGRVPVRQCATCGSGGRCFGPSICCSRASGCLVADRTSTNALLRPCAVEAVLPGACDSGGKPCGGSSGGRCASGGICCDNVSCSTDASCLVSSVKMEPTSSPEKIYGSAREDIADVKTYAEGYGTLDGTLDVGF